eukprot:Hpha_TRINITY_DN36197_c0_g1::TRINITY_DN36197_c0_g1_i1::g.36163::m.36163
MANTIDSNEMRDLFRRWGVEARVVDAFARRAIGGLAFLRVTEQEMQSDFGAADEHARAKLLRLQRRLAADPVGFVTEVPPHHRKAAMKLEQFYQRHGVTSKSGKAQGIIDSYSDSPRLLLNTFCKKYPQRSHELVFLEEWSKECARERGRREEFGRLLDEFFQSANPRAAGKGRYVVDQWADSPRDLYNVLLRKHGDAARRPLQWLLGWSEDASGASQRGDSMSPPLSPQDSLRRQGPLTVQIESPPPDPRKMVEDEERINALITQRLEAEEKKLRQQQEEKAASKAKEEAERSAAQTEIRILRDKADHLQRRCDQFAEECSDQVERLERLRETRRRLQRDLDEGPSRPQTVEAAIECDLPAAPAPEVRQKLGDRQQQLWELQNILHELSERRAEGEANLRNAQLERHRVEAAASLSLRELEDARSRTHSLMVRWQTAVTRQGYSSGAKRVARRVPDPFPEPPPLVMQAVDTHPPPPPSAAAVPRPADSLHLRQAPPLYQAVPSPFPTSYPSRRDESRRRKRKGRRRRQDSFSSSSASLDSSWSEDDDIHSSSHRPRRRSDRRPPHPSAAPSQVSFAPPSQASFSSFPPPMPRGAMPTVPRLATPHLPVPHVDGPHSRRAPDPLPSSNCGVRIVARTPPDWRGHGRL